MIPQLLPGDHLLYGRQPFFPSFAGWFFSWLTSVKTWSPAVHIEVYRGEGKSIASRNGIGVNEYPLRFEQLIAVLRPNQPFDLAKGLLWFNEHARGQGYDWKGLLCFTLAVHQGSQNKMFCSEFATNLDRAMGLKSFDPICDADMISPGQFLQSPAFDEVWQNYRKE